MSIIDKSLAAKSAALGENISTATHKLRKAIMFSMAQRLNEDICFRCGEKILTVDELSIEHKVAWRYSEEPRKYFYDLDNIAFSHLKCNISATKQNPPKTCPRGHNNWRTNYRGWRECRTCLAEYKARWRKENNRK